MKIAINGFGRIGRLCMRGAAERKGMEVVAVNDMSSLAQRAHLLKYDSVHGTWGEHVEVQGDVWRVGDRTVASLNQKDPAQLPWKALGVDVVLECTGVFRDRDKAALHLQAGAKRAIISAPGKGKDQAPDLTVVMGVNHGLYDRNKHHILSNASCTTNCLAPTLKVLHERFGIEHAMMTTVHSYTNDQSLTDNVHTDLRRARAAALSMIPTSTGASEAIAQVLPALIGKVDGTSIRVPTPDVSLIDVTAALSQDVTEASVNQAFLAASLGELKGILAVTDVPLVSTDYVHNPYSATVDLPLTQVLNKRWVKVIAWYDNEWAFAMRMLDLVQHMADQGF